MKQFEFFTRKSLTECLSVTRNYFSASVKGCILKEEYNEETQKSVIQIEHKASGLLNPLADASDGEIYYFYFENLSIGTQQTKITITIDLITERLTTWRVPDKILNQWARLIGSTPVTIYQAPKSLLTILTIILIPLIIILIAIIIIVYLCPKYGWCG